MTSTATDISIWFLPIAVTMNGKLVLVLCDNQESYIYWGGPAGFRAEHGSSLPTHNVLDCAVGDYNGDGALDVAFINVPAKNLPAYSSTTTPEKAFPAIREEYCQ